MARLLQFVPAQFAAVFASLSGSTGIDGIISCEKFCRSLIKAAGLPAKKRALFLQQSNWKTGSRALGNRDNKALARARFILHCFRYYIQLTSPYYFCPNRENSFNWIAIYIDFCGPYYLQFFTSASPRLFRMPKPYLAYFFLQYWCGCASPTATPLEFPIWRSSGSLLPE